MRIRLAYDRSGLEVELPEVNLRQVLELKRAAAIGDMPGAIRAALADPLGSPPLAERARGKRSACILVSDITRPVPNRAILPPLLAELERAGLNRDGVLLLIATGLHRRSTTQERLEMFGAEVCSQYRVEDHVGRDLSAHRLLGETPRGTPVWIDRRYLEAELHIATGLVEPHLMAGYSGGRKAICPGICGLETIRRWHGPELLESDLAAPGVLEGNPVHEEAQAIAAMAGCEFAVNVVLDGRRRIAAVFAGALERVFAAGVGAYDQIGAVTIAAPAPIVVTTAAGYPLDTTWYQAIKGLAGALPAVEQGGTIILAAGLREGMGGDEFTRLSWSVGRLDQLADLLRRPDFFVIDQWQVEELAKAARRARIAVYSDGLSADALKRAGVQPIASVGAGIASALRRHGRGAGILVIPEGPYVLPRLRAASAV